jgi:hypothetical protein
MLLQTVEEACPIQRPRWIGEAQSWDVQNHFSVDQERLTTGRKDSRGYNGADDRGVACASKAYTITSNLLRTPGWNVLLNFHYWNAFLVYGLVLLHMLRVFISGGYLHGKQGAGLDSRSACGRSRSLHCSGVDQQASASAPGRRGDPTITNSDLASNLFIGVLPFSQNKTIQHP